jgi:hypothetical protein
VAARDGRRCRVPGCRRRCWLEAHHLEWFSRGGRHLVRNLIFLCRWHHVQHHEGKLLIEVDGKGRLVFRAKPGWILGKGGELLPDRKWVEKKIATAGDGDVEADVLEALAALESEYEQAYRDTSEEDRGWTFRRAKGWVAREEGVRYVAGRSRGIAALGRRSRGIAASRSPSIARYAGGRFFAPLQQ